MTEIKEVTHSSYGKCLCITNGKIEAYITLDFGPRIMRCGFVGGENFLKEDNNFELKNGLGDDCRFKENVFYSRGGHRFWISPEEMPRTYYPDNDPVKYELIPGGARFIPPAQVANDFLLTLEVTIAENENKLTVNHIAKNIGYWAKEFAPWSLTVMANGGTEIIPQNTKDTGLLSNRLLMLWPYTRINDERLNMTDKYFALKQDTKNPQPFKIGISQEHPWGAYFHHGCMFVKTYSPIDGAAYPDNGCTYETYTNSNILEMETLGELKVVNSGETSEHKENWILFENVDIPVSDGEIDKLAEKYNLK